MIYHWVLPNLHVFPMYFNIIISYYQIISGQQDLQEKKKVMYWAPPFWINEIYLPHFPHFQHIVVYDLSLLTLWYWCNIHIQQFTFRILCLSQWYRTISVLNQNLLQQVEMWLRHVYFHHCHTTRSTMHAYYVILSKKFPPLEDLAVVSIIQTNLPPTRLGWWLWIRNPSGLGNQI